MSEWIRRLLLWNGASSPRWSSEIVEHMSVQLFGAPSRDFTDYEVVICIEIYWDFKKERERLMGKYFCRTNKRTQMSGLLKLYQNNNLSKEPKPTCFEISKIMPVWISNYYTKSVAIQRKIMLKETYTHS